jgi:type II secretory pathway pseudopilin PulG
LFRSLIRESSQQWNDDKNTGGENMTINEKGITLLETLIVVVLVGIIVAISVPLTLSTLRRYRAEDQIREIYASWMEARTRAMQRNVPYIVQLSENGFSIYEDENRDGVPDTTERDVNLSRVIFNFRLAGSVGGTAIPTTPQTTSGLVGVDRRGLVSPDTTIRVMRDSTRVQDSRINCIITSATQIGLGRYDENTNTCRVQ